MTLLVVGIVSWLFVILISLQPSRIVLTESDFAALVSGLHVEKGKAQIILQDIGFERMVKIIVRAERRIAEWGDR